VIENVEYSEEFQNRIAEYATGNPLDRGTKTQYEIHNKIKNAKSFLEFCKRYIDLSGRKFIEIGCGTASISVAAASLGAVVSATDIVKKAVDIAALRWEEHGLIGDLFVSDLRKPPRPDLVSKFDFVFCYQVIEHVERKDQFTVLRNLFSLVAPGGFLFIDTENSMCPFDRHDTQTWLIRLLSKSAYDPLLEKMGKGLNFFEPSANRIVQTRDYLSYDELIGAAQVSGFDIVSPFMPHGDKRQYLKMLTSSDWLHDNVLENVDVERYAPISLLLQRADVAEF
jgi:2-polyprenyl-3-methyl-5-hydroxy-6-metoxy-1,4-benzoquinol methylase